MVYKFLQFVISFILIAILILPGVIAPQAIVTAINVDGDTILMDVAINRGIDTAARRDAPFIITGTIVYPGIVPLEYDVLIKDTIKVGEVDAKTVIVELNITVDRPPVSASDVIVTAKIVSKEPDFAHVKLS